MVGARKYDVVVVKISKILKALPHIAKVQEVSIVQPAKGGLAVSTDIQFRNGQSGIWLLTKDAERDVDLGQASIAVSGQRETKGTARPDRNAGEAAGR